MNLIRFLLSLLLLSLTFGCSDNGPLKIAFLGGLSGRVADLGEAGRNGALVALQKFNQAGGINGRQVELVVFDDGQDPAILAKSIDNIRQQSIELVIGPMTSAMAVEAVKLTADGRITFISPTATSDELAGSDDNFFRIAGAASSYARLAADFIHKCEYLNAATVTDESNRAYTHSWLQGFKARYAELGGEIIHHQGIRETGDPDYAEVARAAIASNAEVLVLVTSALDTARIAQEVRAVSSSIPIHTVEWAATETLIRLGGKAVQGITMTQFFDRNNQSDTYVQFRREYLDLYGIEPGFASVAGYDAMVFALKALSVRGNTEPIVAAVKRVGMQGFDGIQQGVQLDERGDSVRISQLIRIGEYGFGVVD